MPRALQGAPEYFRKRYDTSSIFTWCFSGFHTLRASFWPDGHRTPSAVGEQCCSCLAPSFPPVRL